MTTPTAQATYRKEIVWDKETRDYACYLDGELVGFARDYHSAEVTLDQLVYELLHSSLTRTATDLDGGDPEHVTPVCPECGKEDCPGSAPVPTQSGLCWCITWHEQGHAGECPDCRWRGLNTSAPTSTDPPPCDNCDDKGGCPECDPFQEALSATEFYAGPPLTMDDAVRLALTTSHIPLPDEGRYGHRKTACEQCGGRGVVLDDKEHYRVCLCQYGKGYALGGDAAVQPPTYPPCPACGPSDHHPQRCNVIGQLLMPGPLPEWKITQAVDWERLHAFAASLEKIDPSCPTCGDQVAHEGDFCAACRETGEARYERLLA